MKKFAAFVADIGIFYASLALMTIIRYPGEFRDKFIIHFPSFTFILAVWLLVFYIANLYEIGTSKNGAKFFSSLLYTIFVNLTITVIFFYLFNFFGVTPKTNLAIFIVIFTGLEFLERYYFNKIIARSGFNNSTLIVGAGEQSEQLYDILLANPQLGYQAIGIFDVDYHDALDVLENLIRQKNVKTLVLSPQAYKMPKIISILYRLIGTGIIFFNLSDFYEVATQKIPLGAIDQTWFLENLSEGTKNGYEILKRIFDIGFSLVGLAVSLVFFPLIILAIKLDSRGPAFFKQIRVGQAGKMFTLVKFRNMIANAPDGSAEGLTGPVWGSSEDPRVTRVGRFLRRSRIDELPQLWNVLKGEMSFVGPRPERPEFQDQLKEKIPFYEERYLIKPGLTGWAQIKHRINGMSVDDTAEKLQYDLYYIKNRSLPLDLAIILKTISKLINQEGK